MRRQCQAVVCVCVGGGVIFKFQFLIKLNPGITSINPESYYSCFYSFHSDARFLHYPFRVLFHYDSIVQDFFIENLFYALPPVHMTLSLEMKILPDTTKLSITEHTEQTEHIMI